MKTMIKPLIFVASLLLSAVALAQTVEVPVGQQGATNASVPRPKGGLTMDQVTAKYGQPVKKMAAVGNPPITRWIYDKYTVYFENNRVIHSVLNDIR